jgi:SAM-dependent methyltransferase
MRHESPRAGSRRRRLPGPLFDVGRFPANHLTFLNILGIILAYANASHLHVVRDAKGGLRLLQRRSSDSARLQGGTLVAVDIQPQMIAAVEKKAREAGVVNVETRVASAYDLPLEDESVDRAFLVTVLPEIPDRYQALVEVIRVLKPGGVLSITEEFLDPDYPIARTTIRLAREAGFRLVERHGNWLVYTLNFQKPA